MRTGPPPVGGRLYQCWHGDPHFTCRGGRRSDPLIPGTHWVLKQRLGTEAAFAFRPEELPRKSQLHVGPGRLWPCETCSHYGHSLWRPLLREERAHHPFLASSCLFAAL